MPISVCSSSSDHRVGAFPPQGRATFVLALSLAALLLSGCGTKAAPAVAAIPPVPTPLPAPAPAPAPTLPPVTHPNGIVHSGQQPVAGASIALYAAGTTGSASAARSLLTGTVLTDAGGNFSITGLYTCQPGDQVYLVATGGSVGGQANNSAIALLTGLGPCGTLAAKTAPGSIQVSEVTTAAAVSALAAFIGGAGNLGSAAADANTLAAAFANIGALVDPNTGAALQTSTGNGIVPQTTLDSLANALASCDSSSGPGSPACVALFSAAAAAGNAPSNTLQAALNIAKNPTLNVAQIYSVSPAAGAAPFQPTLAAAPTSYSLAVAHPSDVLTYHNDNARTGAQPVESLLTPANVNHAHFGKKFSFTTDASLFAQPLYVGGVGMPDGMLHNLVIAATTHGTVYAFDADGHNPSNGSLWQQSFIPSGERFAAAADYGCTNPPEAGIVGTPVIDRATQTVYFVTKTISTSGSNFFQRLHSVSLLDGTERAGSPQLIHPTFPGTGDGSQGGSIAFNAQRQQDRAALLLTPNTSGGKTVWIAFASHCDIGPYHGLILGYNTGHDGSAGELGFLFNDTPNGSDGGIWLGAGGLAADAQNNLYAVAGNGTFDVNTGGMDYGDSALKLIPPAPSALPATLSVADFFTPGSQANLQSGDADFGGAEALLIHDAASGVAPNLLVANDKAGFVYLINTDNMGRYRTGNGGANGDVQDFGGNGTFIYNFAFFNNTLYTSAPFRAFTFTPGTAATAGQLSPGSFAAQNIGTVAPVVSANGSSDAIVWAEDTGSVLHAYTAPALSEIYNTGQAANNRDVPPPFVKFTSPIIANGQVFLSGDKAIAVYGPLP